MTLEDLDLGDSVSLVELSVLVHDTFHIDVKDSDFSPEDTIASVVALLESRGAAVSQQPVARLDTSTG